MVGTVQKLDLERNLVDALEKLIPDCLFILGGRNGNEPKTEYCLVQIINKTPQGLATRASRSELIDGVEWQRVLQDYYVDFSLTFYGKSSSESASMAEELMMCLNSFYGESIIAETGFAVRDKQSIERVNQVNNAVYTFLSDTIQISTSVCIMSRFPIDVIEKVLVKGILSYNEDTQANYWEFCSNKIPDWDTKTIQKNYLKQLEVKIG